MAAITWTGAAGDGNFNNPANWSPAQVPGASDTVTIAPSAAIAITIGQADAVQSLSTDKFVTLAISDNASLAVGNTNTANAALANAGTISINGFNYNTGLTVAGPEVTLSGGGTIAMGNSGNNYIRATAAAGILNNTGNTIAGAGRLGDGTLTFVNGAQGIVDANLGAQLFLNTGTIAVSNAGLLEASAGGGGLVIDSLVNNGTGGRIAANGGNVYLANGAVIAGGTLSTSGGSVVDIANTASFDGSAVLVTNAGTVTVQDGATLTLLGTLSNLGTLALNGFDYNTDLVIGSPTVTLTGSGQVLLDNSGNNRIYGAAATDVLDNINNVIAGGGQLGVGAMVFVNGSAGIVDANAVPSLIVNTGTIAVSNAGLLEAAAGSGGLVLDSSVNNAGGRISASGGNVYLANGADIVGGTLSSSGTGSVLISNSATLGAASKTITNTGTVVLQDGTTLTLLGTITNKSSIQLHAFDYNTDLVIGPGGTKAGTVTLSGAGTLSLGDDGNNRIYAAIPGDTLVNDQTISGAGQFGLSNSGLTLVNHGTISATGANSLVFLSGAAVTNDALLQAVGAGGLVIEDVVNNSGGGTILAATSNVVLENAIIQGGLLKTGMGEALVVAGVATLDGSAQTVSNAGLVSLNDGSVLTLIGTITNSGTIALNAYDYNTDLVVGSATVTLTGGGTILLDNSTSNRIYGASASNVLVNVDNLIEGAGQLGTGQMTLVNKAAGIIDANQAADLLLTSGGAPITNAGLIESTSTGGLTVSTVIDSSSGGTILAAGGNVYLTGGTLAGGLVTTSSGGTVVVTSTATLDGSAHNLTNGGLISVSDGTVLTLLGTIVNQGSVALNAYDYNTDLVVGSPTVTLTGNGTIALDDNGSNRVYGSVAADVLDNVNNLIEGAGQLGVGQLTLINGSAGIIDANAGAGLTINGGSVAVINAGLIEATSGGALIIDSVIDSSSGGTILANGADVYLNGGTLAGGVVDTSAGGTVVVNTGGTLDGSAHTVINNGVISVSDSETLNLLGTIDNTGTITSNAYDYNTNIIIGSPTVTLTGSGTIVLDNNGSNQIYGAAGTDVLDNSSNIIEGAGQLGAGQLTLVNSALIEATDTTSLIVNLGSSTGLNTATGQMIAAGAGGLIFQAGIITNLGLIQADNGSAVTFQSGASLTNDSNGTLTGGSYAAIDTGNDASLSITGSAVTSLAANITLSGTGSSISFGGTAIEQSLSTIMGGGALSVLDGRNFDATANSGIFTDNGALTLGGGIFTSSTLTVGSHAFLSGYGTIEGAVVNNGTITVAGGMLVFDGALTGTGTITTGNGGIIELKGGGNLMQAPSGSGTLELHGGTFTLGSNTLTIANLVVDSKTSLTGTGTVASVTNDAGTVTASGGTLTLNGALSGAGTLAASAGSVLIDAGGGTFGGAITGQGTVFLDAATTLVAGISLSAAAIVETADITLGAGASITNHAGDVFTLSSTGGLSQPHRAQIQVVGGKGDVFTNAGTLFAMTDAKLNVAFANSGLLSVQAGTLTLQKALSGGGTLATASGSLLDIKGGAHFAGALTGAGTVRIDSNVTFGAGASLAVANLIDTSYISLAAGVNLTNQAGAVFAMTAGKVPNQRHRAQIEVKGGHGDVFTNAGTVTANAAAQSFDVGFANAGLVSATSGTLSFLGDVSNTGMIEAKGSEIDISKRVTGHGTLEVAAAGTMSLLGGAAAGQTFDFLAKTGALDLTNPLDFAGHIAGFHGSDIIDLANTAETSYAYASGILTVENGTNTVASLHFSGNYTTADFILGSDGHGGTQITFK